MEPDLAERYLPDLEPSRKEPHLAERYLPDLEPSRKEPDLVERYLPSLDIQKDKFGRILQKSVPYRGLKIVEITQIW